MFAKFAQMFTRCNYEVCHIGKIKNVWLEGMLYTTMTSTLRREVFGFMRKLEACETDKGLFC